MSEKDNFRFADIPAPSTLDEARIVELMRLVVREEIRKHNTPLIEVLTEVSLALRNCRKLRSAA